MNPIAPETPPGHQPAKTRTFKMRLSHDDAAKLKSWAHENELSQADFVRFMVFGRTTFAPPNASKLQNIATKLVGIGNNLNECQRAINEARNSGTLTTAQFEAMHGAIVEGRKLWLEPLVELRAEFRKLNAARVDKPSDELDVG